MTETYTWYDSLDPAIFPETAYAQLLERLPEVTPFNQLAWLRACADQLAGRQLRILAAWRGEHMVLCLPLTIGRERLLGMPWRVVRHLGYPLADRIVLAVDGVDSPLLGKALRQIRSRLPHSLLEFNEVLATESADRLAAVWSDLCSYREDRLSCRVPEHRITEADHKDPTGVLGSELRRARRRAGEAMAQLRRLAPDAGQMRDLVGELAAVEQASWKGEEGVGLFSPERLPLMTAALTALAAQGRVRVVYLEREGRCISYRLGLLERGRLYDYNIAYLPEYSALGSGRLLLHEWLMWGLEEGWQWVDASRVSLHNSNHQLHERMDGLIDNHHWRFCSRRPGGILLGIAYRLWARVKPRIRKEKMS